MQSFRRLSFALILSILCSLSIWAQSDEGYRSAKGYYKDIFMDSGIMLTSRKDLPAARYMGLSYEAFISATNKEEDLLTRKDTVLQTLLICGSAMDQNGILLYPDGQPRFRMIYMNGGKATQHGRSLTDLGRERIREYVEHGGSFVGTCAGAFNASYGIAKDNGKPHEGYLGIWPGLTASTGLSNSATGMFVEPDSPLLKYCDFGGDMRIDSVRHNGGCYAYFEQQFPEGTEILLRYDADTIKVKNSFHNQISAWAYKGSEEKGRIVLIGSHPEAVTSGERLDLMSAMIRYAMDGNANCQLKGELVNGNPRKMVKQSTDNDPAFTAIGDKQYHHFMIDIPPRTEKVTVNLESIPGWTDYDLYLCAGYENFVFMDNAEYKEVSLGVSKTLTILNPKMGHLFISVFCDTTVENETTSYGINYVGRTDVLNGEPYIITVSYR